MLSPDQDAFGTALLDRVLDRPSAPPLLLEFNNGVSIPALQPEWFFRPPARWEPPELTVLASVTDGPVLDLGAGAGRHALLMQERGHQVTAIDHSPGAIEVCRRRGARDARLGHVTNPPTDQPWGAVLLMGGNFGLAGGWEETRLLLRRLANACAEDAVIVADSVDPTETPGTRTDGSRDAGQAVVTLRHRYGALTSPWATLFNVPIVDVESLVDETGWRLETHVRNGEDHYFVLRKGSRPV